jgi:hypothetical protein
MCVVQMVAVPDDNGFQRHGSIAADRAGTEYFEDGMRAITSASAG